MSRPASLESEIVVLPVAMLGEAADERGSERARVGQGRGGGEQPDAHVHWDRADAADATLESVRPGLSAPLPFPIAWTMCSRAAPTEPRCTSSVGVPGGAMMCSAVRRWNKAKFNSLCTRAWKLTSATKQTRSNSNQASPIFLNSTRGGGSLSTSAWARAHSAMISAARTGSAVRGTLTGAMTRPVRSLRTRFLTTPEIRLEFGTITVERSKVSISVARTLMRRT